MTESVMVLIPLLITFLSVLQLSTGVIGRTVSNNVVQGSVAKEAIRQGNSNSNLDYANPLNQPGVSGSTPQVDPSMTRIPLPGGGSFIMGSHMIHQTAISPLLPGGDNYEAEGFAITE